MAEPKRVAIPGTDRAFQANPHSDPTALIGPDEKWLIGGLDWSWAFVIYRDVDGFPHYRMGSNGTAWSQFSRRKNPGGTIWTELRLTIPKNRYPYPSVSLNRDGVTRPRVLHRLIAATFYGPRPDGLECRHLDGNSLNNNTYNLKYGTHKENGEDSTRHGRVKKGSKHFHAVLSEEDIAPIFRLHAEGVPLLQIADRYHVADATIRDVLDRVTWIHVSVPSMDGVECRYGEEYRDAGKVRQLHLRRGGSLNPDPKEHNGVNNGPLRAIVEVISRGRYIFDRNHVRFECGHEGYVALKAKRGRCRKCKEMLAAAGTPWAPVPKSSRKTNTTREAIP
jgi:hypothetical protein